MKKKTNPFFLLSSNLNTSKIRKFKWYTYNIGTGYRHSFKFSAIRRNRRVIVEIAEVLDDFNRCIDWTKIENIVIGTDRELINVMLIRSARVRGFVGNVVLLDEGIGLYAYRPLSYTFLSPMYSFYMRLVYGLKHELVKPIGSSHLVNEVGVRYINNLRFRRRNVTYFDLDIFVPKSLFLDRDCCLVFSFIEEEHGITKEDKCKFYNVLNKYAFDNNLKVYIKPHPRENWLDRMHWNFEMIDADLAGEEISFDGVNCVIHFNSSIYNHLIEYGFTGKIVNINTPNIRNIVDEEGKHFVVDFFNLNAALTKYL